MAHNRRNCPRWMQNLPWLFPQCRRKPPHHPPRPPMPLGPPPPPPGPPRTPRPPRPPIKPR